MASDNENKTNLKTTLNNIAKNVEVTANNTATIKMPSRPQSKDNDDPQYTLLDFITGIAGAAFFGLKNKNANNIKEIITNPNTSVFAQINKSTSFIAHALKSEIYLNKFMSNLSKVSELHPLTVKLSNTANLGTDSNTSEKNTIEFIFGGNGMNEATIRALADLISIGDVNYNTPDKLNISKLANNIDIISNRMGSELSKLGGSISLLAEKITDVNDEQLKKVIDYYHLA